MIESLRGQGKLKSKNLGAKAREWTFEDTSSKRGVGGGVTREINFQRGRVVSRRQGNQREVGCVGIAFTE